MDQGSERLLQGRTLSLAVAVLLAAMVGQIVTAIHGQSLTWDEDDHIFAGYRTWKTGDYGLNPEHPPMVKMLATIPLLGLDLKMPPLQGRPFKTEAYLDGRELLFRNGPANGGQYGVRALTFRARLLPLLFPVVGALLVFFAGREMFGAGAGLLALTLFCFEPNLLAHGGYVTTDMAASATMLGTVYAFYRWVKRPTIGRLLVTGVAGGLALAAKHSTVLLLPTLVLLLVGDVAGRWWRWRFQRGIRKSGEPGAEDLDPEHPRLLREETNPLRFAGRAGLALVAVVVVGVGVLWAFYGFRYAARPAPLALSPTLAEYVGPLAGTEARGILLAARLHLLPESWLYGLADVRAMANGMPSYFFGTVYDHGVWFYFPILFTIKSTGGMLALLVLTVFAVARGWLRRWRELWFLSAPPALYMVVAMRSHLNIGARHILPIWIFCCVLAGAGAWTLVQRSRGWAWTVGVLLLAHVATTLHAAPNYISYANELWGGPTRTYRYLSDSNTDWGQQLVAVADYLREHNIHDCAIAYFVTPAVLPTDYGIPCTVLPTADTAFLSEPKFAPAHIDGVVLVSAGTLNGFEFGSSVLNPYEMFRKQTPIAFIQNGVFVYQGSFDLPLAAALGHVQASTILLERNDLATAEREARAATAFAPGAVLPEIALGDVLVAKGDPAGARAAYERARPEIATMLPSAREHWTGVVGDKERALP